MGATSPSSVMAAAILLLLALAATPRHAAGGTGYTVGDADGWTNGINYLAWSQKYNFTVGDTLGTQLARSHAASSSSVSQPQEKISSLVLTRASSVQLRGGGARRVRGDGGRVPDLRAGEEGDHPHLGVGPRLSQPHRAGGLLLHLQLRGPLPRRHEAGRLRGRGSPTSTSAAADVARFAATAAAHGFLCRRASRVAGSGADSTPCCDKPVAASCLTDWYSSLLYKLFVKFS
jgi:hypothetical protein